jgi:hypothetical protein
MPGLWRNEDGRRATKFLVVRRDGTVPHWPWFVLGARDPAAPAALRAYADAGEAAGLDPAFCEDINLLADAWENYRETHGEGDPDAAPHRTEDEGIMTALDVRARNEGEVRVQVLAVSSHTEGSNK